MVRRCGLPSALAPSLSQSAGLRGWPGTEGSTQVFGCQSNCGSESEVIPHFFDCRSVLIGYAVRVRNKEGQGHMTALKSMNCPSISES